MSFVLETAGFKICLLKGGYKAFRRKALVVLEEPLPLLVLGGMTGSGKTVVLKSLAEKGEKIIDLEALANHKGSAFGALGELPQPSNEHFENLLAKTIMDAGSVGRIWVENESRMIGRIKIPDLFFSFMRKAPVIELSIPQNERINEIKRVYANFKKSDLIACTEKLRKKLGGLRMNDAINSLEEGNLEAWIKILLVYYDENYQYAGEGRLPNSITKIEFEKINPERIAAIILEQLTMKL
jgi:tRNA 2-selenouridine synthase